MVGATVIECSFSADELAALQKLIHVAVQARGLEVAEAGVVLNNKISGILQTEQKKVVAGVKS